MNLLWQILLYDEATDHSQHRKADGCGEQMAISSIFNIKKMKFSLQCHLRVSSIIYNGLSKFINAPQEPLANTCQNQETVFPTRQSEN